MRSPSARVLVNRCNVLPLVPAQDAEGGPDPSNSYPAVSAASVPCSYQCQPSKVYDEDGRASTVNEWAVLFATPTVAGLNLKRLDRLDLLNADGTLNQSVYVTGPFDYAGRSSTTEVVCSDVV